MGINADEPLNLKDSIFATDIVEYVELDESQYQNTLAHSFYMLDSIDCDTSLKDGCIVFIKILNNILLNPWDQSKRWINTKSNVYQLKIKPHAPLMELFKSLGFKETEDHLYLNLVSTPRIKSAYNKLITFVSEKYGLEITSNADHFFDPFKAYKHSSTVDDNKDTVFEIKSKDVIAEQINEIKHKLNDNRIVTHLVRQDMDIKLINSNKLPPKSEADAFSTTFDEQSDQAITDALIRIKNLDKNFQFKSKSKEKLDNLLKCKIYDKSRVKFVISPLEILELTLPCNIKIAQIHQLLKELGCIYSGKLCVMPLRTDLSPNSTLMDLDLVPSCTIHIVGSTGSNYIDKDMLNRFQQISFTPKDAKL